MRGGTLFSGIGAPECSAPFIDWRWAAEIEPFPSAVHAARFPGVINLGDVTEVRWEDVEPVDLVVAGSPCQSFSVAGKRLGMDDPRGNLALVALNVARRVGARWLVFENVPGLLSSFSGAEQAERAVREGPVGGTGEGVEDRDFATFLAAAAELGYFGAWRSFDAQYAGLAQRRERVFVVLHPGDWRPPAAVLLEPESLSGTPPPRREAGKNIASTIAARTRGGGGLGTDAELDGAVIPLQEVGARTGSSTDDPRAGIGIGAADDPMFTLQSGKQHGIFAYGGNDTRGPIDVAAALNAHGGPHGRIDFESETFIAHTLRAEGFDASEDGTGRGIPLVPIAFDTTQITSRENGSNPRPGDPCHPLAASSHPPAIAFSAKDHGADAGEIAPTLRAGGHDKSHANGGVMPAVAYDMRGRDGGAQFEGPHDTANIRASSGGSSRSYVAAEYAVRHLTPTECETLQGFPTGWTAISYRGRPAFDGPRYKALGNAIAVPCIGWILNRINLLEEARREA